MQSGSQLIASHFIDMRRRLDKEGKVRLIVHRLMSIVFHHHNNHLFLTFMIILLGSLFEEKTLKSRRSNRIVRKKKYSGQQEICISLFVLVATGWCESFLQPMNADL